MATLLEILSALPFGEAHITMKDVDVKPLAELLSQDKNLYFLKGFRGKIDLIKADIVGAKAGIVMSGFHIKGDPVKRVEVVADFKVRTYTAKVYALGGLITYEGSFSAPKEPK